MPYKIEMQNGKHCVVQEGGTIVACHPTHKKAQRHLAALYANVTDAELKEIYFSKEKDGSYKIVTISTAALKDREDETFSIAAMDYDIRLARETGQYPEFRVFHSKVLGFGRVEKMQRVGIFMVDEGHSYNDPFSIEICEKMLINNDEGKWRVSRGFAVHELQGHCYKCGSPLSVQKEHFLIGFRCPGCESVHLRYKGALDDVVFRKVRTFDVSVTDVPAVTQTSAMAYPAMEDFMTKKDLEKRLLLAGISKEAINDRLADVDEEALKEFDEVPTAVLLKELDLDEEETEEEEETETDAVSDVDENLEIETPDGDVVEMDAAVVHAIKEVVRDVLRSELDGLQIDLETTAEKEYTDQIAVLKEEIADIKNLLKAYLKSDTATVNKMLSETPRKTKARVLRFKAMDESMDEEDEEDEEDEMEKKSYRDWIPALNRGQRVEKGNGAVIGDGSGETFGSLAEMVGRSTL